jgi:hypothetical protein
MAEYKRKTNKTVSQAGSAVSLLGFLSTSAAGCVISWRFLTFLCFIFLLRRKAIK